MATISKLKENLSKPAPKWFKKLKKAILILVVAANLMIASWGITDQLLTTRLQLWFTVGVGAILEALEAILADEEDYVQSESINQ